MEAFGTLYDCIARSWWDETPAQLQQRCLLHLLRLAFPEARGMITIEEIVENEPQLSIADAFYNHPILEMICHKAYTMSQLMPEWEIINSKRRFYEKLIKCLLLRFVVYHHNHLNRLYCTRCICQLLSDLLGKPIHLHWCTPKEIKAQPDCVINPSNDIAYFSDMPIVLCCEKDPVCGQAVFVLVKSEQEEQQVEEQELRFVLNSDEEMSFTYFDSPYALWYYDKSTHQTDKIVSFQPGDNEIYYAVIEEVTDDRLYFLYPNDPTQSLFLPFPEEYRTYIFASDDKIFYVSEMTTNDIYVYFALPSGTKRVIVLMDRDRDLAHERILKHEKRVL